MHCVAFEAMLVICAEQTQKNRYQQIWSKLYCERPGNTVQFQQHGKVMCAMQANATPDLQLSQAFPRKSMARKSTYTAVSFLGHENKTFCSPQHDGVLCLALGASF